MALWIKLAILGLSFVSVGILKKFYPYYKDDNVIEEFAENMLAQQTGFNVDLTPGSPEEDNK